ncbi:hypothetical protein KP509_27G070100 [Ceratopteris richardii]|uniref:alpha,alpha-trehalose-phosphate synthase (UDP-forming) n=1 Tax=Ceratopteris richardii TaxID=49495 RepID=A0A8T2RK09_CERRI|nr:hypothetical protein KP509_27G070100 [Ceratopteris richardii]KAH7295906.1 hypothetical protein KP509_27G070100 [Ceratopteris richardii]
MVSRSYANLSELSGRSVMAQKQVTKVFSSPVMSTDVRDDEKANSIASDVPSSMGQDRMIIVGHFLPLRAARKPDGCGWSLSWDRDALLLQLRDGLPDDMDVIYVGCLNANIEANEQDEVSAILWENFKCVPAFLPVELNDRFYLGFCKQQLWPLFHYMLPLMPDHGGRFDRFLWQAYVTANRVFADKIMEVISPDDDYVWIHDYHLMVLPTFLRNKFNKIKLGFFLHSPFPSSEVYRTLPVREEILRGLLNADLVGFHTFDYARHFLSCCSRMLGLEYESKRGYIGIDYYGRTVSIKIMPVGIHMGQLENGLRLPVTENRVAELSAEFKGKIVLLGVDDMDVFKGISLKLLALEELLRQHAKWRGKVVLVQIVNPARGRGKDVKEVQVEAEAAVARINREFGYEGYSPVVLIEERQVPMYEKIAYYSIAECCIVTAVRDGMNLIPYEYIVCRQGTGNLDAILALPGGSPKKSMLIVSEFIGCSPSLSGAVRVNPWNIEAVAEAMNSAITMPESEKQMRHEKHYKYVSTHNVAYWAQSCVGDLERSCRDHSRWLCYGLGFGLGFRVVALDPHFQKLLLDDHIVSAYKRAKNRVVFLDYDGTMVPQGSLNKTPSPEVLAALNKLCQDSNNTVFIVSGRGRQPLSEWFSPCGRLGIAAEHGFFYRCSSEESWQMPVPHIDFSWKEVVSPVLKLYTESTDGSYVEAKESALVWHYQDADPDFGLWQAKELLDHLESVLANEPLCVKTGQQIIEVKPQGVSKGVFVDQCLSSLAERGKPPDFVLCVGDDRSDEDMFESIEAAMGLPPHVPTAEVFACTVGRKPSKAKYFLDDTSEVLRLLVGIATALDPVRENCSGSLHIEDAN